MDEEALFGQDVPETYDDVDNAYGGAGSYDDDYEPWGGAAPEYEGAYDEDYEHPYADDEYAQQLRDSIVGEVGQVLHQALAPMLRQQVMNQLGDPHRVAEYVDGLSAEDLAFVATHPGLSRALRLAAGGGDHEYGGQAPHSEWGYMPERPSLTASDQRELQTAQSVWADQPWFDAKAFRDMTFGRSH
jgi:hypothetical protein